MENFSDKKSSSPLFWITLSYSVGILGYEKVPFVWICVSVCFLLMGLLVVRQRIMIWVVVLLLFFGLGVVSTQVYKVADKNDIVHSARFYYGKTVKLQGVVSSDIEHKKFFNTKKSVFTLNVQRMYAPWGWQEKRGKVLVNVFKKNNLVYGDSILIEGKLHRPYDFSKESNFSYPQYLSHRNIFYVLSVSGNAQLEVLRKSQGNILHAALFKVRNKLKMILDQELTYNESGIMKAILLGDRSHIPKQVRQLFSQTGTAHILAISGLHVGVVAALFLIFLQVISVPRRVRFLGVIVLLIGYAILTGGRASVVRATVMACIFLGSFVLERESNTLNTLSLAALILLIFNPLNLFDIGFQLSFSCVLAIIFFNPVILQMLNHLGLPKHNKFIGLCVQSASISISVWFGVLGLTAYYFNIITPITVFANLLIVPFISILVVLGFGVLLTGSFIPFGLFFVIPCIKVSLNLMVALVFLLSKIPYAYISLKTVYLWHIAIYYGVIFILFGYWNWYKKKNCVSPFDKAAPLRYGNINSTN